MALKNDVERYVQSFPKPVQKRLNELRKLIRKIAPKVEEKKSYGIIGYKGNGPVIYISGFKKHVGVYPVTGAVARKYKKEIAPYLKGKASLQFLHTEKIPLSLVKKIVTFRLQEDKKRK